MNKFSRFAALLLIGVMVSGCANQNIKPVEVICPLLGGVLGAGVVAGGLDGDGAGPMAAGAVVGAGLGYFLCKDRTPEPKPAPAPAPRPAPKPAPPPPPPPPPPPAPEVGTKIEELQGAHFDFDKATLRPEAAPKLDHAVAVMNEHPEIKVSIEGHTDSVGSDAYNQGLSERRANAVRDYLVGKGISPSRLHTVGYGEARPAADNSTDAGRAQNRRVELIVGEW